MAFARILDHVERALARMPDQFRSGDRYVAPSSSSSTEVLVPTSAPTWWLTPSSHLISVPAIDRTSMAVLAPGDFDSWEEMLAYYPTVADYLFTPGDYTVWGDLLLVDTQSGTLGRSRTFRYFNPADDYLHPVARVGSNEALVSNISFEDGVGYWHVHGLTVRAGDKNIKTRTGAHHITFDWMLLENLTQAYGVRILSAGGDATVQRTVIRNANRPEGTDSVGVQSLPDADEGYVPRTKLLDCEIYNIGDSFAVSDHGSEVGGDYIVDGCDLYLTSARYRDGGLADGENSIDLKEGSVSVQSVIKRTRMWGQRRNLEATAAGDAVITHRFSNNVRFEYCIVADSAAGWREVGWPVGYPDLDRARNFEFYRVGFCDISNYSGLDTGTCIQPLNNTDFDGCTFARSDYVARQNTSLLRAGGPTFSNCRRVDDTELLNPDSVGTVPYSETGTNTVVSASVGYAQYERKRWTGSEVVAGPFLATDAADAVIIHTRPPLAGFTYSYNAGQVVITSTAAARHTGATLSTYAYTFGDGGSSATANPSHTYSANGAYSIKQTATDSNGLTDSVTRTVYVTDLVDSITMPSFVAAGTLVHSINFIDVAWPAGHLAGDVALLITERGGDVSASSLDIAAGFNALGSSVSAGNTNPTGTRLDVYWCRADAVTMAANGGSMPSPRVSDNGNHQAGVILTFRDCIAFGNPVDVYATSTDVTTTTAVSIPGATTTANNCRVVAIATSGFDTTAAQFSGWTNASLSSLTEIFDAGGDSGNGGVIGVATGGKAVAGAYSATTATLANAAFQARMSLALLGAVA